MANRSISMRMAREILRLYFGLHLKKRQIGRACGVAPSTVVDYVQMAEEAGISWPLPENLDDAALEEILKEQKGSPIPVRRPLPDMEDIHVELRKKGVTMQLLWLEYKEKFLGGYQYSQFCEYYNRWAKTLEVSLRQEHRAGEKMFIDFAGKTVPIIDPSTGEITEAEIFVAVLGASNYTYAEALPSQSLPFWIRAHIHAFEYFQGISEILVPDNLKSGVTKSCRYEPDLNPVYLSLAQHYGTAIIPARPGKPKDKAKVEAGVLLVTRWIIAALRHHTFFSIEELNERIRELLERLNTRKFKKLNSSRRELFESLERPSLKPLPEQRYRYIDFKRPTVNIDYHVDVDGHFYSVPYQLNGKKVEVFLSADTVEIFHSSRRIVTHQRSYQKGKYTTLTEHMPKSHQKHLEWTPSRIINWAEQIGPATGELIETILSTRPHPQQGFRSCLGILRLGKEYSQQRLEAASIRAV
ncbi:MAG: IS21 family transposase, partial [Nitrospirota bacterium]